MAKYYSIYNGKEGISKIVTSWEECKKEVIGCKGVVYKSFKTEMEAIEFLKLNAEGKDSMQSLKEGNSLEEGLVVYVDGSFSLEKKNYSYGFIVLYNGVEVYEESGIGEDKEAVALRNVSGEVLGSLKAIEYAINNGYKEIKIVYDYQGVESWAIGAWKRNNRITQDYYNKIQIYKEKINIRFIKVKGHSGDKYNDIADKLAKKALGI